MKRFIFTLSVFFTFCYSAAYSQVVITEDWTDELVESLLKVLPITDGKTIEEQALLSGALDAQFQDFNPEYIVGKETENWFQLTLTNETADQKNIYLGTNKFEYLRFWIKKGNTLSGEMLGGHLRDSEEKQIDLEGLSFFNFEIQPRESVKIILHAVNENAPITPQNHLPVSVMTEDYYSGFYTLTSNISLMFTGACIVMAIFNFLFYLVNRFPAFLYYTIYIISALFFALSLKQDSAYAIFGHMDINRPFLSTAGTGALIFYAMMGRELLRTKITFPRADKVLKGIIILEAISLVGSILFPSLLDIFSLVNFSSALIIYPMLLALGGMLAFKKDIGGIYFFIASFFLVTGVTVMMLMMIGILPPKIFGMTAIIVEDIGLSLELAFFALGLGAIFNDYRQRAAKETLESEQLAREKDTERKAFLEQQNQVLETKINDRTKEVFSKKEELETALNTLQTAQNQLIESEKMASLGQFTAGVAAEIKNPINFVSNGVENLKENSRDMIEALRNYEGLSPENFSKELLNSIIEKNKNIQLAEAIEDSDGLFKTVENGVERTLKIVNSLRNFARLDESEYKTADIHEGINATIEILKSQFKGKAEIIRNYGTLPLVLCYPGKLNQVFLNLINNAVAAVPKDGRIKISTEYNEPKDEILISVENNGAPIPKEYHEKIFEPFYTIGKVSKKKGLGLSICRSIMDQHNGSIHVESEQGKDTAFRIRIPANPSLNKE